MYDRLLHTKACLSVLHVICRLNLIIFPHNIHHPAVFILNVTPGHIFSNILSSQISSCQKQNHSEWKCYAGFNCLSFIHLPTRLSFHNVTRSYVKSSIKLSARHWIRFTYFLHSDTDKDFFHRSYTASPTPLDTTAFLHFLFSHLIHFYYLIILWSH